MGVSDVYGPAAAWAIGPFTNVGAFATHEAAVTIAAASLLLAVLAAHWRNRKLRADFQKLKHRVAALEAAENSRFIQSLNGRSDRKEAA
jgi:membrane protein implicated in regulation of membrane protease activity